VFNAPFAKRIFDARRAGFAIAPFAHREALPSCPAMGEFSCKHEIRLQTHSGRLRNSLPRHSQKRIFDARRAGFAIAPFAHREALPSYLHVSMKSAYVKIRVNCVKMY